MCSATGKVKDLQELSEILRFQCPLELCVFCDHWWVSPSAAGSAVGEFQCPLELCVFCDQCQTPWGASGARLVFQCPLELCVFCDSKEDEMLNELISLAFQCPLELCVFCDHGRSLGSPFPEKCFSALSSFVCSATRENNRRSRINAVEVSVPSRALCVLRPSWNPTRARASSFLSVSVPSRALCVLRLGNPEPRTRRGVRRFSALSSFVCSATGIPVGWVNRNLRSFSALSSFVCSATIASATDPYDIERFQCPLELCVFCDEDFQMFLADATQMRFQCPLELCVFCDE